MAEGGQPDHQPGHPAQEHRNGSQVPDAARAYLWPPGCRLASERGRARVVRLGARVLLAAVGLLAAGRPPCPSATPYFPGCIGADELMKAIAIEFGLEALQSGVATFVNVLLGGSKL